MESSSSSSSCRRLRKHNHDKVLQRTISPAIQGKTCPICLKDLHDHRRAAVITVCLHAYCLECIKKWSNLKRKCPLCNADFDSLFYKIDLSSRRFLTERLPAVDEGKQVVAEPQFNYGEREQIIRRARAELGGRRRRSSSPHRRTFGRVGSMPSNVIEERKLQWRASVYNRHLQAVPMYPRCNFKQEISRNSDMKERIRQRIEPWIQRELQAILGDPDPSVIVHVASSRFIAYLELEGRFNVHSGQNGTEDSFLEPLQRFLHGWTNAFWHELRCFAGSSLSMEAYDEVVQYKASDK